MILATLRFVPHPGEEARALHLACMLAASSTALPGCLKGEVLHEAPPSRGVVIGELWSGLAPLEARLRSRDYDLALGLMEASAEPPCLAFHFVSESRGVSWVEELRQEVGAERAGRPTTSGSAESWSKPQIKQRMRKR